MIFRHFFRPPEQIKLPHAARFGLWSLIVTIQLLNVTATRAQPTTPPQQDFDNAAYASSLDYTKDRFWLALPGQSGLEDLQPSSVVASPSTPVRSVAVFYVHPTTYLSGGAWIDPLEPKSVTHENKLWMLAHQASIFNLCCEIYAPLYRQASIYAYLEPSDMLSQRIFDVPYQDLRSAFRNFIQSRNPTAPYIIASHSQGTHHMLRLLAEEIDNTPQQDRLVVAYTLGATVKPVSRNYLERLQKLKVCDQFDETGCFVHWDTAAYDGKTIMPESDSVCVNPLSWRRDETRVSAKDHKGALPVDHPFTIDFGPTDAPRDTTIQRLRALRVSLTGAQCQGGVLRVDRLSPDEFLNLSAVGNYHLLDFSLFYADIQQNAKDRITAYTKQRQLREDQ
jgi:hypothetical protein